MFDEHAAGYEALRRRLVPSFDAFYGTAVAALELAGMPAAARARPRRRDRPARARARARAPGLRAGAAGRHPRRCSSRRARSLGERASYVTADLTAGAAPRARGTRSSARSRSTISRTQPSATCSRACTARCRPGGVFVNAEQVKGADGAAGQRLPGRGTSAARAPLARALRSGRSHCERQGRRPPGRRRGPARSGCARAGFEDVDCLFKDFRLAVLIARRED